MSEPIYVQNTSELQLPKLIEKSERGLADLMPGEVGKVPPEVAEQPRVSAWLNSGRLKMLSEEDFLKHFDYSDSTSNIAYKAKVKEETPDDETVAIPGMDELPEIDDIPQPDVANLDGTISIRAPDDDEPLTERAGDTLEVDARDLHAKRLNEDGSLSDLSDSQEDGEQESDTNSEPIKHKPPTQLDDLEPPSVNVEPTEATNERPAPPPPPQPVTENKTADTSDSPQVQDILNLSAWRRQVKAVKECSDVDVILSVGEQTHREVLKKACAERVEELS